MRPPTHRRLVYEAKISGATVLCVAVAIYVAVDTRSVAWAVMGAAALAIIFGVVMGALEVRRMRREHDDT